MPETPQNPQTPQTPQTTSRALGINLSPVNYYATQAPFDDVFRNRDAWISSDSKTWDTEMADSIPVDTDGYPLEIPYQGQMMAAPAFLPIAADSFDITWQGDGDITLTGPELLVTDEGDHSMTFKVGGSMTDSVFLRIVRSNKADHMRAIAIHARTMPYDATFRASLAAFSVLRFMDWGATNDSPIKHWIERTTEGQGQGSVRGVAIETMVDTANMANSDMWFNIPHQADDDYVQRAAMLIGQRLQPKHKVYIEYSNENWNAIFPQVQWEQQRGVEAGLDRIGPNSGGADVDEDAAAYWAGLKYAVRRAAAVHDTFRRVVGKDRVVAVLAGQSSSAGLNDTLLEAYADTSINPLGGKPDALAIAPYFGSVYMEPSDAKLSVNDILADAEASINELVAQATRDNRKVADMHGMRLISYEAGQHLLATGDLQKDDAFVDRLVMANRSARMGDLYTKAHKAWVDNGGDLAVYFSSCQAPNKYGSWGALEYQGQPAAQAPKWSALNALATKAN
jgi:hypothetical protein